MDYLNHSSIHSIGSRTAARLSTAVLLSLLLIGPMFAHSPDTDTKNGDQPTHRAESSGHAVLLPNLEGPSPWSDAPVLNDPERFHIAIMTDRTGGHRPGVWMQGVKAVNLLRPEFVVSVGDLIEGYTEDRNQLETEWKEFLGFIDQMEMKFFFVAGNHDVSNPTMHDMWREHFGPEWYSFDYKGVHFVCLSSEDPLASLSRKQLAWVKEDLKQHEDARWTLIFLHKPLWTMSERQKAAGNPDYTGWPELEQMLGSRPHTCFAGHVHHYVQYDRNGKKYYHLATTGGGSRLRGKPYGEFDHVMWLTMEKDGPHVANLTLEGVLPGNVVTEESISRFREFLAKTVVEVAPIWVEPRAGFSQGQIYLRLTNHFDVPIELTGQIQGLPLRGLTLAPEKLVLTAQPGETANLALGLNFTEPMGLDHLTQTLLTATARTLGEDPSLTAQWSVPITIDRKYDLMPHSKLAMVDGLLDDWEELRFSTGESPRVLGAAESWQGQSDASIEFDMAFDQDRLLFAGHVHDDAIVAGDAVEVWIDSRSLPVRAKDTRLANSAYTFRIDPTADDASVLKITPHRRSPSAPAECIASSKKTSEGYDVELAVPLSLLQQAQGKDWQSLQVTVVVHDVDEQGQPTVRILWRGTQDYSRQNTNYGQFVR